MIDSFSAIKGDFSLSALSMRLYAPSPEELLKYMPDATPEKSLENWEVYCEDKNWNNELQSILYIGNFVHEFVHLLQHTTFFQCMAQVSNMHKANSYLIEATQNVVKAKKTIPHLPLIKWLEGLNNNQVKKALELHFSIHLSHELYLGNRNMALHISNTTNRTLGSTFCEPFNPKIRDLTSQLFSEFQDEDITSVMLLESQATMIEFNYISGFFSEKIALNFVLCGLNHSFLKNYDLIPYIAISQGIHFILPSLIEWSFEGTSYLKDGFIYDDDYSNVHPPWRFIKLVNALKTYMKQKNISHLDYLQMMNIEEIKHELFLIARIKTDSLKSMKKWINSIQNRILKRVFENNFKITSENPTVLATFPSNMWPLANKAHMPMLFYRDNVVTNKTPTQAIYALNSVESTYLSRFARDTYALNRMIEGNIPLCPHCIGTEHELSNGYICRDFPPAGQLTRAVSEDLIISEKCGCDYAYDFKQKWGLLPEELTTLKL